MINSSNLKPQHRRLIAFLSTRENGTVNRAAKQLELSPRVIESLARDLLTEQYITWRGTELRLTADAHRQLKAEQRTALVNRSKALNAAARAARIADMHGVIDS
jgi:hypothetical protein